MSTFHALFPFLPSSEKVLSTLDFRPDSVDERLLRRAAARFSSIVKKKPDFSILPDWREELVLYPILRALSSYPQSEYYADLLARYYADRTVRILQRGEGVADFFADLGMFVDPSNPSFPLPRYMSFPHIYPETKIYHLPVRAGMVYVPRERLPLVAGCIAYALVRKGLPIDKKTLPEGWANYALSALRSSTPRRGKGKGIAFIERIISASGIPDGRKRILFFWLIPYWVTVKGLSVEEAVERAKEWVSRQGAKIYESWIRSEAANAKKRGIRPWSLEKVKRTSPDLIKLLSDLGLIE